MPKPSRVSSLAMGALLASATICVGLFIIPTLGMNAVGRGVWLVPVGGMALGVWGALALGHLCARFPQQTMTTFSQEILGKALGRVITIAAIVFFVLDASIGLRVMSSIESQSLLPKTPLNVVVLIMLALAVYMVWLGLEVMTRVAQVIAVIFVIPLLLFIIIMPPFTVRLDVNHLKPFLDFRSNELLSVGFVASLFMYRGFTVLCAMTPSLTRPKSAPKIGVWAVVASFPVFVAVTLYPLLAFGWPTANYYFYPFWQVAILVKTRAIPIERPIYVLESAVQGVILLTACSVLYAASVLTKDLLRLKSHRGPLLVYAPFVYALAVIPDNALEVLNFIVWWLVGGVVLWVVAPTLMLGIGAARGLWRK